MKVTVVKHKAGLPTADLFVCPVAQSDLEKRKNERAKTDVLSFAYLLNRSKGNFRALCKRRGFEGKPGQSFVLHSPWDELSDLLIIAPPKREGKKLRSSTLQEFRKFGTLVWQVAKQEKAQTIFLVASNIGLDNTECFQAFLEGVFLSNYYFEHYKSNPPKKTNLSELIIAVGAKDKLDQAMVTKTKNLCDGVFIARDLVNLAPSDCPPRELVSRAKRIAKQCHLRLKVYSSRELKTLGAGGILAVSRGSNQPPYLIKLSHVPRRRRRKEVVALVGKGVTFDSGGLSIKPAGSMETMKYDMAGAAAVLASMYVVSTLDIPLEVHAYIPAAENMISGAAMKPGDVFRAINGKSIEVLNTDAEGRLLLADALSLASREQADLIIDLATLTGACVVALGSGYAGYFCDDDDFSAQIEKAAASAGERVWRLPLAAEYAELIKSPVADLKNSAGRHGGAITAALFLKEFVGEKRWLHLDIAGPAYSEQDKGLEKKGGTGFGVRTVVRFLEEFVAAR